MNETKVMTVSYETSSGLRYPKIKLSGDILHTYGFTLGQMVKVSILDNTFKLEALGTGLDVYREHVMRVRQYKQQLTQVQRESYLGKTSLYLNLQGSWLKRQNYLMGEVILVTFSPQNIEIRKLDLLALGFESVWKIKVLHVHQNIAKGQPIPRMVMKGNWLSNCGFKVGESALLTYQDQGRTLYLRPCLEKRTTFPKGGFPPQLNVRSTPHKKTKSPLPLIQLTGRWLNEVGYEIGDPFLIGYKDQSIRLKQLNLTSLV